MATGSPLTTLVASPFSQRTQETRRPRASAQGTRKKATNDWGCCSAYLERAQLPNALSGEEMAEKAEPAVASIAELLQAQDSMFDLETFTKTHT